LASGLHISDRIAAGETPDKIMAYLQGSEGQFGQLLSRSIRFHCGCSHEKVMGALAAISEDELRQIEEETGGIEVRCHYCNEARSFRLEQLLRH
jgi:molecular chaperone Hsp33